MTLFQELMTLSTDDAFSSLLPLLADQISSSVSYLAVRKKKRGWIFFRKRKSEHRPDTQNCILRWLQQCNTYCPLIMVLEGPPACWRSWKDFRELKAISGYCYLSHEYLKLDIFSCRTYSKSSNNISFVHY